MDWMDAVFSLFIFHLFICILWKTGEAFTSQEAYSVNIYLLTSKALVRSVDHLLTRTNTAPNYPLLSLVIVLLTMLLMFCLLRFWHCMCVRALDSRGQTDPVALALSSPLDSKERWERRRHQPGQLNSCKAWLATSSSQVRAQLRKTVLMHASWELPIKTSQGQLFYERDILNWFQLFH